MIRTTLTICRRLVLLVLHVAAGLFLLGIALILIAMWKFSQGPIDLTFAAGYIRDSLQTGDYPVDIKFGKIVAEWPDLEGAPDINLSDFVILEGTEEKLHIGEVGVQIALLPLLIGKIEPETIVLKNPVIRVIRSEEGNFQLLVADTDAATEAAPVAPSPSASGPSLQQICDALFLGGAIPGNSLQIFSSLRAVNITNARLVVEDHMANDKWTIPGFGVYLNRSEDTFDLSVNYTSPERSGVSMMNARVSRAGEGAGFSYSADLRNADLAFLARNFTEFAALGDQKMVINGIIEGKMDRSWKVQSARATVRSPEGNIRFNTDLHDLFSYKNLMAHVDYDRLADRFTISDTSLDINGTTLSIRAERGRDAKGRAVLPVQISIPQITLMQVASLWPAQYQETHAAEWLTRNLSGATLRNIVVTASVPEEDPAAFSGRDIEASFDFENLTADYRAPLLPATQAKGRGTIKNDVLDIIVDDGKIGDLKIEAGQITITELTADQHTIGQVTVRADLSGPLATVFDYIARDPINLGKTIGLDPAKVGGQGDYKVDVAFPALRSLLAEQVIVKVDAALENIRLPGIVHGMDLSGGPFTLKVADGSFTLSGKGQLQNAPIDLVYTEYIDPATAPFATDIKASVVTDQKLRRDFGLNLDQFIAGSLPLDIHYKEPKPGDVSIDVKADLTPARAFLEPLYFTKPEGSPGSATCVVTLKDGDIQQVRDLNILMGPDKASGGQLQFGRVGKEWDVRSGAFESLVLGSDNAFSLKFTQKAPDVLDFVIKGSKLDGRSFLEPDKAEKTPGSEAPSSAVTVSAQAKTMRTGSAPDQVIRNPVVTADIDAKDQIRHLDISAAVGDGPFHLVMKPDQAGAMVLKMTAADAGKTLRAFDIYDNMVGGALTVDGKQIAGGRINDIKGSASIRDFRIVKAPALAQLINGISLSGAGELLQNRGIAFTKLRTDYIWKDTPQGRVISLSDGRTSGASIGLSFGGSINQSKGTLDISGTFVPMSEINKIVSSIPLIGTILTGGRNGGIIAATYAMKGNSDNPSVFVNPLSVLTPGFLRSILFEGGMDLGGDDDNEADQPKPARKASRTRLN